MKRIVRSLPVAALLYPVLCGSAAAQTATEAQTSGIGDIVVTAEKRETSAQKTPVALSVFDAKTLAENGGADLRSLQNVAPALQIGTVGTNTLLTVRGVSSRDATEIGDPAIAVSIDNFYLQRAAALNSSIFDVERVEVLRGPQGTLYGRNATGGAINISSVKPKLGQFQGFGAVEYGSYDLLRTEGAINIPLGETFAARASFMTSSRDGYSKVIGQPDGDDDDSKAARLHLLFQPSSRFHVLLTGEYTKVGGVGPVVYGQPYSYTTAGTVDHGDIDIPSRKRFAHNTPGSLDINTKSVRAEVGYDLGFMTATYYGGYRKFIYHRTNDAEGTALNTTPGHLTFPQNENEDTQNHELRFASRAGDALSWQAGLYYFKEQNTLLSYFGYANTVPANYTRTFSYDVGAKSKAAFAQVGYALTDQLKVEGGIRYSDDSKYRVGFNIINGVRTNQNSRTKNDKVTWHVGVNFQATPENLLYAKVDTGYKAGGFTDLNQYGPESVTAYEVGSKNRFMDDMLQVNLSAFYYDYTDLQVSQYRTDGRTQIVNAGKAENYGFELETILKPSASSQVDLSVNYLHARYKDFAVAVGGVNVSYAGNHLIQAPTWSIAGGIQQAFDFAGGEVTARLQSHFQTRSYFSYRQYDSESQKAFSKTDITLNYAKPGAEWSLLFYVRNLEDKRILVDATEYGSANVYRLQFAEPRTYGARFTYNF